MPKPSAVKRHPPPTPGQIIAEQKIQAQKLAEAKKAAENPVPAKIDAAKSENTAVAVPDNRSSVERYLDATSPVAVVGRLIKFNKEAKFCTADDDVPIDENAEFVALCDETLIGWIKFHNDGETPPDRIMGALYDGFVPPRRDALGDMDEAEWPAGPSGEPEDPWKHQNCVVLQHTETRELYTFVTTSITGRTAVANLLRHYNRTRKTHPDELPIIRLRVGGFNSKKPGVGWVSVPVFAIVGRASRTDAKPDSSIAADLNDELPKEWR